MPAADDLALAPGITGSDDCVGCQFAGERETVLYLPHSGEVLLCAADAWQEVGASRILDDPAAAALHEFSPNAESLLATLAYLGIDLG